SRVASGLLCVHAVAITPAGSMEHVRSSLSIDNGFPCVTVRSAPAVVLSGPAQRSLTLRPARSPSRLATLYIESSASFVASDATYGNGEFLQWLLERGITPYMRTRDSALRKNSPLYGPDRFTYLPESNSYRCPAGQPLSFVGLNVRNRTHAYIGSRKRCGACPQKAQCTTGQYKYLAIHIHEPARQRARDLANTPAFAHSQRERRKVE